MDTYFFADTLKLENNNWLLAFNLTKKIFSILRKTEESFNFLLVSAFHRTNPVTMKQKLKRYWKLKFYLTFPVGELLSGRDLAEGKSVAADPILFPL